MSVKETAKGSRRYVIEFEYKGRRVHRRCPENTSKAEAEVLEATLRKELFTSGELGVSVDCDLPGAIATWLEEVVAGRPNADKTESHARGVAPFCVGKVLTDIAEVAEAIRKDGKATGLSPLTVNRRLCVLKGTAKFAWKVKKWSKHNLSAEISLTNEKGFARNNRLTAGEVRQIADAMPSAEGKAWVMLAAYTGLRKQELYKVQPEKIRDGVIDLGKGRANGKTQTKNSEPRMVPVGKPALPYLKAIPWTRSCASLDWEWRTTRDAAGFSGTTFHDLRHTFASLLINKKVDLYTIGRLLGNDPAYTTGIYSHLELDTLKAAVRKLA